jgi:hypothetical protein
MLVDGVVWRVFSSCGSLWMPLDGWIPLVGYVDWNVMMESPAVRIQTSQAHTTSYCMYIVMYVCDPGTEFTYLP